MSLTRVQAYKTTDEQTFTCPLKALDHQLMIDLRGLMQSKSAVSTADNANSPTSAATLLTKHRTAALEILRKDHQKRAGFEAAAARAKAASLAG